MVPHNRPSLGQREADAATRVLESGWVAQGSEVTAFENELCTFLNLPEGHAVAVSSGSAALYLALWALQAQGQRVGVPVYSCASLRNAVGMIGAEPVYLDCEPDSPNAAVHAKQLGRGDALILPSIYGIPATLPPVSEGGAKVIEDIAQALGARSGGQPIGNRGTLGVCSFYATKLMTSGGQGGAVFSRDKALVDAIRDYREFDCRTDHVLRFNFQMTDLQAAIGRVQLARLPEFLARRTHLYDIYRSSGLHLLDAASAADAPARLRAVVRTKRPANWIQKLTSVGVRAIVPIETSELLDTPESYPNAHLLSQTTVSLPVYPSLTDEDAQRIAHILQQECA